MIVINDLYKKYGKNSVLNGVNVQINSGEITALVGKNGSGKSTLIKILSGLIKADSGKIDVGDKNKVGVLLGGSVSLYNSMTAKEIIDFFGFLRGMSLKNINKKIDEMDEILGIKNFINERASTFSRGMSQKIAITVSLIHDPDVLLLDEPSTGLDIEAANDVIKFIKYLKDSNKTIFIATHNIFEISDLSDSIAFLKNGIIDKRVGTYEFFCGCNSNEKSNIILKEMEE